MTDTDGVGVWPNVSSCTRDESRSRPRSRIRVGVVLGRSKTWQEPFDRYYIKMIWAKAHSALYTHTHCFQSKVISLPFLSATSRYRVNANIESILKTFSRISPQKLDGFRQNLREEWGMGGKSDATKFLARMLQGPERKKQKTIVNTSHRFNHFHYTDFQISTKVGVKT